MTSPEKKENIVFFLEYLAGGGAEKNMIRMANYLSDLGYPIDLVLSKVAGQLTSMLSPQIRMVDLNSNSLYTSLPKFINYINQNRPRLLISTLDLANIITIVSSKLSAERPKTIIRIASTVSIQYRPRFKKILEKLLLMVFYPMADVILAVSDGVADDLAKYAHIPRKYILRLYSPVITPDILNLTKEPVDHPWFQPGEPPVILGVGRLNREKNYSRLIYIFSQIRKDCDMRLLILGEGEQRSQLESLVTELGLEDCVQLPGYVDNPYAYMSRASVFVLSSDYEGLPTAMIEAMACGCPVVAVDCPSGPAEILAGGKYGELVPLGDEDLLVSAIQRVLDGRVKKVPPDWLTQFNIETFFKNFMGIITDLHA